MPANVPTNQELIEVLTNIDQRFEDVFTFIQALDERVNALETATAPDPDPTSTNYAGKPTAEMRPLVGSATKGGIPSSLPVTDITRRFTQAHRLIPKDQIREYAKQDLNLGVGVMAISIKLPNNNNWTEVADGVHDDYLTFALDSMADYPGMAFLFTAHHEYDGGGGSGGGTDRPDLDVSELWRVNQRIRSMMSARDDLDHVSLMPIPMSYSLIYDDDTDTHQRDIDTFWPPEFPVGHPECPFDLLGADIYFGNNPPISDRRKGVFNQMVEKAKIRNADLAIGETGMKTDDPEAVTAVMELLTSEPTVSHIMWFDVEGHDGLELTEDQGAEFSKWL